MKLPIFLTRLVFLTMKYLFWMMDINTEMLVVFGGM